MNSFVLSVIVLVTMTTPFSRADESADLNRNTVEQAQDLTPAASGSSRFFDLSSLFPRPYYNTNTYRPTVYNPQYPTGTYNPYGGGAYNPGYGTGGVYNPGYGTGTYNPGYGTSGYNPGYNGYGTNSLGGGYGGYGGYGGNGGIGSYVGYYNDQYRGNRNLGYGYYRGTDRYGFYSDPSTGYRGYN